MKYPEKQVYCENLLSKEELSELDVILLDEILCESNKDEKNLNAKHRSYDKHSIFKILEYQKKTGLNNIQLARHFKLSRNTIAKWKRMFYSIE